MYSYLGLNESLPLDLSSLLSHLPSLENNMPPSLQPQSIRSIPENMQAQPKTATSFSLFPCLAPELRIKIWQLACLPRTITVRYNSENDKCISSSPPPAILQACHESRVEAQKIYKLCFGTASQPAHIYFNPHLDTLYLPRHREMGYDDTLRDFKTVVIDEDGSLDQLRRVAIEHVDTSVKRPWESYNKASLLREFRQLDEVILVLLSDDGNDVGLDEEIEFVRPKGDFEMLLRMWVDFRQSFVVEERLLESVCKEMETPYVPWTLPSVKIKSKVRMV